MAFISFVTYPKYASLIKFSILPFASSIKLYVTVICNDIGCGVADEPTGVIVIVGEGETV